MARPVVQPMELSDAPKVEPSATRRDAGPAPEPATPIVSEPQVAPAVVPEEPPAVAAPPVRTPPEPPSSSSPVAKLPQTMRDTLRRVDDSWRAFYAAAARFPAERMNDRLGDDRWTLKQMLAHVAAWHDLTADRMIKFINTGQPPEFEGDVDAFNATVARRAVGKTAGEVLNDTQSTFNRLRRQLQRLTDVQLRENDWWAAWVIEGNTYGHYDEHWDDIYTPEPAPGTRR